MTDQFKGLIITAFGVLFVVPDSLFVRLIDADALVIAFWRGMISGGIILIALLALQGTKPIRLVLSTGWYGWFYMVAVGASGILFIVFCFHR